jgi:hypothetical protein
VRLQLQIAAGKQGRSSRFGNSAIDHEGQRLRVRSRYSVLHPHSQNPTAAIHHSDDRVIAGRDGRGSIEQLFHFGCLELRILQHGQRQPARGSQRRR